MGPNCSTHPHAYPSDISRFTPHPLSLTACGVRQSWLSIHFVVASDIKQDNFFLDDTKCQGDAVGMGDADGMKPFKFPAEGMQSKGREKGIGFEVFQRLGEWLLEFRVGSRNLDDTPIKMAGRQQHIHQTSRPSSPINVCAVTRRTRPAFTSFNERRIRETCDLR